MGRKRLKCYWGLFRFLVGHHLWTWIGSATVLVGVAMAYADGLQLAAVGVALVNLLILARELFDLRRRNRKYYPVGTRDPFALRGVALSDNYAGYETVSSRAGDALTSSAVNDTLWGEGRPTPVRWIQRPFRLPATSSQLAPTVLGAAVRGRLVFNDKKVSLRTDLSPQVLGSDDGVQLQPTTYFAGQVTNELTGQRFAEKGSKQEVYDGTSLVVDNGVLSDLSGSQVSNQVGASTLAFLNDGMMILPIQAPTSAHSAQLLAPSGSGSTDLRPARDRETLEQLAIGTMDRELAEECDVESVAHETRLMGFARLLDRGGKPEFLGLTYLDTSSGDVRVTRQEQGFISTHEFVRVDRSSPTAFRASIEGLMDEEANKLSVPLAVALFVLLDTVRRDPDGVMSLVRGERRSSRSTTTGDTATS